MSTEPKLTPYFVMDAEYPEEGSEVAITATHEEAVKLAMEWFGHEGNPEGVTVFEADALSLAQRLERLEREIERLEEASP